MRSEDTDDFWLYVHPGAQLLVGSRRNWSVFLEKPQHGTPTEDSNSLSMQPVCYTSWCSTDAVVVVESPQTIEDDLRSARTVRGRRTS